MGHFGALSDAKWRVEEFGNGNFGPEETGIRGPWSLVKGRQEA